MSTKNLVFKKRPVKKLVDQYVSPYFIEKVISTNIVKLWLFNLMRIHLIVNISWIVIIQRTSEGTEDKRSETSGSKESWRVRSRKNFKQKKNTRSYKVSSMVERIYGKT